MTIVRHDTRRQVCCDTCPASYPNTYEAEDFAVMITDARSAGWIIRKAQIKGAGNNTNDLFGTTPRLASTGTREEPYTHTCPSCAKPLPTSQELL